MDTSRTERFPALLCMGNVAGKNICHLPPSP